jgi:hypothetical protein
MNEVFPNLVLKTLFILNYILTSYINDTVFFLYFIIGFNLNKFILLIFK